MATTPSRPAKPVVSSHTIWILSGILVGAGVTELVPEAFRISTCLGGIVGLIAYFTLQSVARRKERREAAMARRQNTMKLEGLVDRHISRLAYRPRRPHFKPNRPSMDKQYVTVAAPHRATIRSAG